jgi:hypothetical protein
MSKALVDKLIKDMLSKVDGETFRKKVDKLGQVVTVTKVNLAQGIKEGYLNTVEENAIELSEKDYLDAAGAGMASLIAHLAKTRTLSRQKTKSKGDTKVVFTQPRAVKSPFNALKRGAIKKLSSILEAKGKGRLTSEDQSQIMSGVERLHQGKTTVGTAQLVGLIKLLDASKSMNIQKFVQSEQIKSLTDLYGKVEGTYKVTKSRKGTLGIQQTTEVAILVDATSNNYPGSENFDWKNIKKELTTALNKWANRVDWENQQGSKSPKEEYLDAAEHAVISNFQNKKNVTVKKRTTAAKLKNSKQKTAIVGTKIADKATKKIRTSAKPKKASRSRVGLVRFLGVLNQQLPSVVAKNMGSPALNYQTGRFASGVRATDISRTPQGFPSIGYTYQLYPYQTFEPGYAQGDPDRDPRPLINRSIREIMTQFAIGRFYTRRQ